MGFVRPEYLLAAVVVLPAVLAFWFAGYRARKQARKAYGDSKLVDKLSKPLSPLVEFSTLAALMTAAALLVLAVAGPVLQNKPERIPNGTLQVVVVLDVSKSMLAEDYRESMPSDWSGHNPEGTGVNGPRGSRMDMAKYQIERIMKDIAGNQLGYVTYTGEGFPQAPLTTDFNALKFVLREWVKVGNAPGGGSDYARGLKVALQSFKEDNDPSKTKVIVLMSDGGFTGIPEELADVVKEINAQGVKLVIVGIGTPGSHAIPIYQGNQLKGYMQKEGKPVTTSFEEDNLRRLQGETGGVYHHVDIDAQSQAVAIDWAATLGGFRTELKESHIYVYLVGAALALLTLVSLASLVSKRDVV